MSKAFVTITWKMQQGAWAQWCKKRPKVGVEERLATALAEAVARPEEFAARMEKYQEARNSGRGEVPKPEGTMVTLQAAVEAALIGKALRTAKHFSLDKVLPTAILHSSDFMDEDDYDSGVYTAILEMEGLSETRMNEGPVLRLGEEELRYAKMAAWSAVALTVMSAWRLLFG